MYNKNLKKFTALVIACSKERAEELMPEHDALYPQSVGTGATECVMDRMNGRLFMFAYGKNDVWACNDAKWPYMVCLDQSHEYPCYSLSEAISIAKGDKEIIYG